MPRLRSNEALLAPPKERNTLDQYYGVINGVMSMGMTSLAISVKVGMSFVRAKIRVEDMRRT